MDNYLNDMEFLTALDKLQIRTHYAKIVLLTFDERPIKTIEGAITAGTLNVNASSAVRRTINLTMLASPQVSNIEDLNNDIAIDKKVRIYIGYDNPLPQYQNYGSPVWFPCGTFFLTSVSISRSTGNWTISIQGRDKMCQLDGTCGGTIPATLVANEKEIQHDDGSIERLDAKIYDIIFEAVNHYGGEDSDKIVITDVDDYVVQLVKYIGSKHIQFSETYSSFSFTDAEVDHGNRIYGNGDDVGYEETEFTYPGELTLNAGDTVVTLLDKIAKTLGNFEYFYDVQGVFHFQQIKNYLNTASPLNELTPEDYLKNYNNAKYLYSLTDLDTTTQITRSPKYNNLKNDFYVYGTKNKETQICYHLSVCAKPQLDLALQYLYYDTVNKCYIIQPQSVNGLELRGTPCSEWREELYRQALIAQQQTGVSQEYYDQELIKSWREAYELKDNNTMGWTNTVTTNPDNLTFWLDFIDTGSDVGKYSVNKIGRRTKIVKDSGANVIYNKDVPEVLFVPNTDEGRELRNRWMSYGKKVFLLTDQARKSLFSISTTGASCFDKLREVLYQNLNYNTTITITCLPKYYMDVNNIIYVYDKESQINGNYQITQFSLPLTYNGTMSITATEVLTRI